MWLADISYLPTGEGFLYLAAMKDLSPLKIVGWAMSKTIDAQLVVDALDMAIARQRPRAGLTVHSDRGSQYANREFRNRLGHHRMQQSMSRRGNCCDNAPMESFFSSLKGEYLEHQRFATHAEGRAARPMHMHVAVHFTRT